VNLDLERLLEQNGVTFSRLRKSEKVTILTRSDDRGGNTFSPLAAALVHFSAAVSKVGDKVTSHSFRHTYGTLMAEAIGSNPFIVQKSPGHGNISTTARYCHVEAGAPNLPIPWERIASGSGDLGATFGCHIVDISPPDET
jgi:integrase